MIPAAKELDAAALAGVFIRLSKPYGTLHSREMYHNKQRQSPKEIGSLGSRLGARV